MAEFGQAFIDAVLLGGIYTLMAIGLTLSLGITRVINFSHGETIMLGAYGAYFSLALFGIDPLIALPFVMIIAGIAGYFVFRFFISPVLDSLPENQILLTFGIGLVLQNAALISWTANERSTNPSYTFSMLSVGSDLVVPGGRLIAFGVALVLVVALFVWLKYGELGRACRALAENRQAAVLMGIDVPWLYAFSFGVSVALAAATGVIVSFLLAITPFMGFDMLVKGFAIIILGGLGSVMGSVIGAFLLSFSETMVAYYVPNGSGWAEAVAFVILFVTLIVRPRGIAGQAIVD
jgi:branched-chain amino acid transport system permease protein